MSRSLRTVPAKLLCAVLPSLMLVLLLWVRSKTVVVDLGSQVQVNPKGRVVLRAMVETVRANPRAWKVKLLWRDDPGLAWAVYDRRSGRLYSVDGLGSVTNCTYTEEQFERALQRNDGIGLYCY